jgi:hypothetical protein
MVNEQYIIQYQHINFYEYQTIYSHSSLLKLQFYMIS